MHNRLSWQRQTVAPLEQFVPRVHVHAVIRDMPQLRRSGRVSLGQALLAGVLSIKPILYMGQSVAEAVGTVRGWPGALEQMVAMVRAKVGEAWVALAMVHTDADEEARQVLKQARQHFNCAEAMATDAGTALGSYAGVGAVGIVTIPMDGVTAPGQADIARQVVPLSLPRA
jgi:DegV family protein with EDD domain